VHDSFPFLAKPTVDSHWPHGTSDSSVAHRTVRCDLVTVGPTHATAVDCVLTIGAGENRWPPGSLDSSVHTGQSGELYLVHRALFPESGQFTCWPAWTLSGAHRIVQCSLDLCKFS
jgi:hypothetical protein